MKSLSRNRAVAPQSTMAAVAMLCPLPQIFTWMQKCDAVGSISQIVDILHEERELYKEVAYGYLQLVQEWGWQSELIHLGTG